MPTPLEARLDAIFAAVTNENRRAEVSAAVLGFQKDLQQTVAEFLVDAHLVGKFYEAKRRLQVEHHVTFRTIVALSRELAIPPRAAHKGGQQ